MSATDPPDRPSENRSRSLIGAGTRIEGGVEFSGGLTVRGAIAGDVRCRDPQAGTLLVDTSGCIDGAVTAPCIVIKGRVNGPLQSTDAIEVHSGGKSIGDVGYRLLAVHRDAVVAGTLNPLAAGTGHTGVPARGHRPRAAGRRLALAALVLPLATALAYWAMREAPSVQPPASVLTQVGTALTPTVAGTLPQAPAASPVAPPVSDGAATAPVPPAPPPAAEARAREGNAADAPARTAAAEALSPAAERPEPDEGRTATITGINAERPAGLLYVVTRAPAVLYKKKAGDALRGTRIEIAPGRNISVRIGPDERLRVAAGPAIDLYFQGLKVAPAIIDGGDWMRFVPLAAPAATPVARETAGQPPASAAATTAAPRSGED